MTVPLAPCVTLAMTKKEGNLAMTRKERLIARRNTKTQIQTAFLVCFITLPSAIKITSSAIFVDRSAARSKEREILIR